MHSVPGRKDLETFSIGAYYVYSTCTNGRHISQPINQLVLLRMLKIGYN